MKIRLMLAAFALIAATFAAAPAAAQAPTDHRTAQIPFEFQVGDVAMPAGDYILTLTGNHVTVRSLATGQSAVINAIRATERRTAESNHLGFDRVGNTVYLSNVYFAGANDTLQLLPDKVRAASRM